MIRASAVAKTRRYIHIIACTARSVVMTAAYRTIEKPPWHMVQQQNNAKNNSSMVYLIPKHVCKLDSRLNVQIWSFHLGPLLLLLLLLPPPAP